MPSFADGIKINEICSWPKQGLSQWLELLNPTKDFINVAGFKLKTSSDEAVLPNEVGSIAAGGALLIVFDGQQGVRRDGKTTLLHMPIKDFLGTKDDQVALMQFVTRGNDKTKQEYKIWQIVDAVSWGSFTEDQNMVVKEQGMSLGVLPGGGWIAYEPKDITPGGINATVFYAPIILGPQDRIRVEDCPAFSWISTAPKTMVQFSSTPDFSEVLARVVVTDKKLDKCPKSLMKQSGTYYWRLRGHDDQGHVSAWSTPRAFLLTVNPVAASKGKKNGR